MATPTTVKRVLSGDAPRVVAPDNGMGSAIPVAVSARTRTIDPTVSSSAAVSDTPTTVQNPIPESSRDRTRKVARITGLAYLGLGIFGAVGFMLIRGKLFVSNDAVKTAANLVEREGLARARIAADLGAVLTQAVAAVLFYVLFRHVHAFAAASLTAFGLMNAAALLFAVGFSATALDVALDRSATSVQDAHLLYRLQGSAWEVGGLFFGLWLLPMGWLVLRSAYMPRAIGWLLLAGGTGYLLSTFLNVLLPNASGFADALLVPSTIGEVWMIGYLLIKGVSNKTQHPFER